MSNHIGRTIATTAALAGLLVAGAPQAGLAQEYEQEATPMASEAESAIMSTLRDDPRLARFARLIEAAGLDHELGRDAPVTILAPINEAFALIVEDRVQGAERARKVVEQHILPEPLTASELRARESVRPIDPHTEIPGFSIEEREDGTLVIDEEAWVVESDLRAGDSVIHLINRVLLPEREEMDEGS